MNRNRGVSVAAVVAAVVAVIAVVAGVTLLSRAGLAAGPPVLRLATSQGADAAFGSSMTARDGARGSYRLTGTLPLGPSEARVRHLQPGSAPAARVRTLASALGETAAPVRVDAAWKVGKLMVTDEPGNPWTWGTACGPDTPVSSDSGGTASDCNGSTSSSGGSTGSAGAGSSGTILPDATSTGVATGSPGMDPTIGSSGTVSACPPQPSGAEPTACDEPGIPLPEPLPPKKALLTEPLALAATARIRDALGLDTAPTRVEGLSVVVEPLAGGLPTNGIATLLQLSEQARLVGATGWLSTGGEGGLYPLRTARKAFDELPVFALGAPCDAAGCPEGPAITGARLGLSRVALLEGEEALVPAWLFTVQDSSVPLVALAVDDRYLGGPDPTVTGPGTEPGATEPGTTQPGPDGSVAPLPPQPPSPTSSGNPNTSPGREAFGFDGAYPDADPKVLVVRYGDSGSCPSLAVRHVVVEQGDRVVVTLTRTPMPGDRACTMDYQAKLVRVALTAPLGGREVVDGSRKQPVPISTGTPPFG